MALTAAQLQTLKAAILADPNLNSQPNTPDGNFNVAAQLNALASPAFTVWKSNVSITDVGNNINSAELGGLTTANTSRLSAIADYHPAGFRPADANTRAFFDDIFSGAGGVNTRALLLALWKRLSTYGEKVLKASGTGTDASPAILGFEGPLTYQDVEAARNLP